MQSDPIKDHPWILAGMSLAVVLGVFWLRRVWLSMRGEIDEESSTTDDLLTPLALAYKSGQMSEEEYRRIRDSLVSGGQPPAPEPRRPRLADPPPPPPESPQG